VEAKIPAKRFGEPEEIAHTVLFLCTEKTSYMTANKIKIDGGLTL
jgi:3-oxoacyl-[acyl-carrier protein] reductase